MSAIELIQNAGFRGGWGEGTRLQVLADFIDNQVLTGTLSDYLERRLAEDAQAVPEQLLSPRVTADIHSDDRVHDLQAVDVTRWFAQADEEDLECLWQDEWGGSETADEVTRFIEEENEAVSNLLEHCRKTSDVGFECYVNEEEAKTWIRTHRKEFWGQHCSECGYKHTKRCLGGGRCTNCGTMICAE